MPANRVSEHPLRILQIIRAPVGGLFRHVLDLSFSLAERGHQLGLVADSLVSDSLTDKKLEPLKEVMALGIHRIPISRMPGPTDITAPFRIRKLARELNIEVLHGHGAKGGLNARLARLGTDRVAFYTPHGGVLNYKPGSPSGYAFRIAEGMLASLTDTIVFESQFAKDAYVRQIGKPKCHVPVVVNGLAPRDFEPIPVPPKKGVYDFVFVGELRPVKGVEFLLEALGPVKAADGRPATLLLAGDGPDAEALRAKVVELGLSDRVHMPGAQPAREMFALGHCVIIPSLAESLPYVVLEAAAGRRPVLTTNVGGISEIFGPTKDRLLPAGQAEPLRDAMQAFLVDPSQALTDMQTRLDYISGRFSLEKMTNDIEALYLEALGRR